MNIIRFLREEIRTRPPFGRPFFWKGILVSKHESVVVVMTENHFGQVGTQRYVSSLVDHQQKVVSNTDAQALEKIYRG